MFFPRRVHSNFSIALLSAHALPEGLKEQMLAHMQLKFNTAELQQQVSDDFIAQLLLLANPGPAVTDKLYASSFANTIGEDKIFLTVAKVVAYCSPKLVEDP
ncbi:hypothetical protein JHK87_055870 [Glycine soja]|nr:hypothetical protein JHK87_055870 [Glycine soja]